MSCISRCGHWEAVPAAAKTVTDYLVGGQHVRVGAGIHGDVLNVHTGTC